MRALTLAAVVVLIAGRASAATAPVDAAATCTRHLEAIGRALSDYQKAHGEPASHLSDLYPEYLAEKELLLCPADLSAGPPGPGLPADLKLPVSYLYTLSGEKAPELGPAFQLGPQPPGPQATWRERVAAARVQLGDYVPLVTCTHHAAESGWLITLAISGQVYRSGTNWDNDPGTVTAVLRRLDQDLQAGPTTFERNWSLDAVERYAAGWVGASLPPALRYRLGMAADRLSTAAGRFAVNSRREMYRLAVLFHQGAGQAVKAIAAAAKAGDSDAASFLRAELRYRANGNRGSPPVDEYLLAEMARQHVPGMTAAVVRGGKIVLAKGYGMADRERSVPATEDTVYNLASIGKLFTATGIMMLVEEGKLSLEDRIGKFILDAPASWSEITVRHLLTHTSGIPDATVGVTTDEVIQHAAQSPLEFAPGEQWSYSNAAFSVLGRIIERVSGKPLDLYLDERIYRPLHMDWTARGRGFEDLKIVSKGYHWENGRLKQTRTGYVPNSHWLDRPSTDGYYPACSTAMDLVKFAAALSTEKLLKKATLEEMWTPTKLKNGQIVPDQGLGWWLGNHGHQRVVFHGGGSLGIQGMFWYFPETRSAVILLAPLNGVSIGEMTARVADYCLPAAKLPADADRTATQKLKRLLQRLAAGKANPDDFAPEARDTWLSEAKQTSGFYQLLGPLRSFRLIEQASDRGQKTYHCRARFRDTTWTQSFVLTGEGKIAELGVRPE